MEKEFSIGINLAKAPYKSTTGTDGDIMKAGYPRRGVKAKLKRK